MRIQACFISNTGKVRARNEDSILLNEMLISEADLPDVECRQWDEDRQVFAVADGMGGHARGEAASKTVLAVLREAVPQTELPEQLHDVIRTAKGRLDAMAREDPSYFGAGTTLTGLILTGNGGTVFSCGDSRVYRITGSRVERLTRDDSMVQELVDAGVITEEGMRTHAQKNILTAAIMGDLGDGSPRLSAKALEVGHGDRFLICSDGVWEALSIGEMTSCLQSGDIRSSAQCMSLRIVENGARDNFSLILLEVISLSV